MIPTFSFQSSIEAVEGRQDRIQFILPLGELWGSTDAIDDFRSWLSATDAMLEGRTSETRCIFNRPNQRNTKRFPQTIRRRPHVINGETLPVPIFAGELRYSQYYRRERERITHTALTLVVNCNPTRFARFIMPNPQFGSDTVPLGIAAPECDDEFALDGKDNWILQGEQDAACSAREWPKHVLRYLESIETLVLAEIAWASYETNTEFHRTGEAMVERVPLKLATVETYWEFEHETPLALVSTLHDLLQDFSMQTTARQFPSRQAIAAEGHEGNALFATLKIRAGVTLKLYAKTNRRIRLEVEHDLQTNRRILADSHRLQDLPQLAQCLSILTDNAAAILNRAFSHIRRRVAVGFGAINEAHLLLRIGKLACNESIALVIVELLRSRGAVAPDNRAAPLRLSLIDLSRHGVLSFNRATGLYEPTELYRSAVRRLQNRQDPVTPAPRRRPNPPSSNAAAPTTPPLPTPRRRLHSFRPPP